MARIPPVEAARLTRGTWVGGVPAAALAAFSIDSRRLQPGEVFVALRTERNDGHAFVGAAREAGALAALVESADPGADLPQLVVADTRAALQELARHWRQRFAGPVIGVTGSFGKTTVKEMLGAAMGEGWFRTSGNLNNDLGVPLSLLQLDPESHRGAILEAGINGPGEMDLLAGLIRPDSAVITAIGPAHLERLGDLEQVAVEKARLAQALPPGGHLFIPADLLRFAAFRELSPAMRVHALAAADSTSEAFGPMAENITFQPYNWTETPDSRGAGRLVTRPPAPAGDFALCAGSPGMVSNLSLVVHVALHMGVTADRVGSRLAGWKPFRQRGEILRVGAVVFYADCYNANPGSMLDSASRFARLFPGEPHLYVLGSMNELGAQAEYWHRETGRKLPVQQGAEVYLVGAGSAWMAEGLRQAGVPDTLLHPAADLAAVRERLRSFTGAVFLKGSRSYGLEALLPQGGSSC